MSTRIVVVVLAATTLLWSAVPAHAGVPTDTVRDYTDAVLKVLEDPALKQESRRAERRAAVRKIAIGKPESVPVGHYAKGVLEKAGCGNRSFQN